MCVFCLAFVTWGADSDAGVHTTVTTAVLCCVVLCWAGLGWGGGSRRPWSPVDLENVELEGSYWPAV